MKSQLFFVKLSVAVFFPLVGVQQASAQRVSDLSVGHHLPYSQSCSGQGYGRSAVSSLLITAVVDCKIRPALHLSRHPSPWVAVVQGSTEYALVSGSHAFVMVQTGGGHSTPWGQAAVGMKSTTDKSLRGFAPSLSATAVQADSGQPRVLSLNTIKLVLMATALALLVLGVGHKAVPRW